MQHTKTAQHQEKTQHLGVAAAVEGRAVPSPTPPVVSQRTFQNACRRLKGKTHYQTHNVKYQPQVACNHLPTDSISLENSNN